MIRSLTIVNLGHTRPFRAVLSFAVLLIVLAVGVSAQQPDDTIVFNTALVQLNVGVVDRQGRAITTLSRNDFKVYEDRRPPGEQRDWRADREQHLAMSDDARGDRGESRRQNEQPDREYRA